VRATRKELTKKYRALRLQPDVIFLSRVIQTFFSKFTKQGKKELARRQIRKALMRLRLSRRHPNMHVILLNLFSQLRISFQIVYRRRGRILEPVPVPVRRNKRDSLNKQLLYRIIRERRERSLAERISEEIVMLASTPRSAASVRRRSADTRVIYEARTNMELR
jgi:ribosomal protein S7